MQLKTTKHKLPTPEEIHKETEEKIRFILEAKEKAAKSTLKFGPMGNAINKEET